MEKFRIVKSVENGIETATVVYDEPEITLVEKPEKNTKQLEEEAKVEQ